MLTRLKDWMLSAVAWLIAVHYIVPVIMQIEYDHQLHAAGQCDWNSCLYCHEDGVCARPCKYCFAKAAGN